MFWTSVIQINYILFKSKVNIQYNVNLIRREQVFKKNISYQSYEINSYIPLKGEQQPFYRG